MNVGFEIVVLFTRASVFIELSRIKNVKENNWKNKNYVLKTRLEKYYDFFLNITIPNTSCVSVRVWSITIEDH